MVVCSSGRRELRGLSLCAGYAGLDLGIAIAEPSYRTVGYVEREAHAAATLVARMEDEALDRAPIWDDLKSFDGKPWRGRVHIISAGYPCQPFSIAGKRGGRHDPRHLWPDVERIIGEVEPEVVFAENVEGHLDLGFAEVAASLRKLGYHPKAGLFTAREAGGRHRRRRLFVMAYAHGKRCGLHARSNGRGHDPAGFAVLHGRHEQRTIQPDQCSAGVDAALADYAGTRLDADHDAPLVAPGPGELQLWRWLLDRRPDLQPALLRADYGMADRVERTRGAGNGVFSMAAALGWRTLSADFAREGWRL
ncbi:MAG: DNA cytosine methyltransferase [Sphingopyxis solisilvae]|uniref:DNA cytosine methyltransferase n=1 Tax=Sphingopyxis solisilvae TaxID=1886788 RepID=UPI0040365965